VPNIVYDSIPKFAILKAQLKIWGRCIHLTVIWDIPHHSKTKTQKNHREWKALPHCDRDVCNASKQYAHHSHSFAKQKAIRNNKILGEIKKFINDLKKRAKKFV